MRSIKLLIQAWKGSVIIRDRKDLQWVLVKISFEVQRTEMSSHVCMFEPMQLAAILSIELESGEIHPVAFHSCSFNSTELNYDVHDKELYAIFEAFRIWRHYLDGALHPIDVVTDHKNLEYLSTTKILNCRQARWLEYLCQFNLVICFCPGKLGTKPDALTRR